MERKEAYELVKKYNLQKDVEAVSGTNYTRTPTSLIEAVIKEYLKENVQEPEPCNCGAEESKEVESAYEAACLAFLGILKDTGKLDGLLAKLA